MSFNRDYIYDHLPARYRREDKDLFLKRFLTFVGETLDEWDETFDNFFEQIQPATASVEWVEAWLLALFGWSWFPRWFRLADKRRLYGNFARHLARRGTRRGIELWLADFGVVARVHARPVPWGEFVWGETCFSVMQPLHLVVEILFIHQPRMDAHYWGEGAWGEAYYTQPTPALTEREIIDLIRYVQPHSQEITLVWRNGRSRPVDDGEVYWHQISF